MAMCFDYVLALLVLVGLFALAGFMIWIADLVMTFHKDGMARLRKLDEREANSRG